MTIPALDARVHDSLAQKRIAVAGVSRNHNHHPRSAWSPAPARWCSAPAPTSNTGACGGFV